MKDAPLNILFADGISAAGTTVGKAVGNMLEGAQALRKDASFRRGELRLGIIGDLDSGAGKSRAFQLLEMLCRRLPEFPREGTRLYLATTVGAIDLLERAPAGETPDCTGLLLQEARRLTGVQDAVLVAAACAS
ncbi:MAG: hypothetical protein J5746_02960, partial [Victivallales bacterium]|nr:hypothetical protein [Victivallales bacterium]